MGSTTVDRYISQFEMVDRYSSKLDRMTRQTDAFARKVDSAKRAAIAFSVGVAGVLSSAVVKLGTDAVKASAQFEQFAVTLEVLTGSSEKAARKLDFIRRLAAPSPFTFQELAAAGTQLEAFRVPLEKALPLISKLGAAFPNKELQDFVSLFGRLASGDFPDLEALSGAGLSKLDFVREGIKFDAQGSLLSSTRDTMDALERIIERRYGTILDRIANTTSAKLATVRDKWDEVLRRIGDVLIKYVNPALDAISKWLDNLSKNDKFEKWMKRIAVETLKWTAILFGALATLNAILALMHAAVGNWAGAFLSAIAAVVSAAASALIVFKGFPMLRKLFDDMGKINFGGPGQIPVPTAPPGMEFPDSPSLKALNGIEENTRRTADNTRRTLDLRRYALGGGDIAAQGISAIERYGGRGSMHLNVTGGRDKLGQAMAEIARETLEQYLIRNGGRM